MEVFSIPAAAGKWRSRGRLECRGSGGHCAKSRAKNLAATRSARSGTGPICVQSGCVLGGCALDTGFLIALRLMTIAVRRYPEHVKGRLRYWSERFTRGCLAKIYVCAACGSGRSAHHQIAGSSRRRCHRSIQLQIALVERERKNSRRWSGGEKQGRGGSATRGYPCSRGSDSYEFSEY